MVNWRINTLRLTISKTTFNVNNTPTLTLKSKSDKLLLTFISPSVVAKVTTCNDCVIDATIDHGTIDAISGWKTWDIIEDSFTNGQLAYKYAKVDPLHDLKSLEESFTMEERASVEYKNIDSKFLLSVIQTINDLGFKSLKIERLNKATRISAIDDLTSFVALVANRLP